MELLNGFNIDLSGIDDQELDLSRISTLKSILLANFGQDVTIESAERLKSKKNVVIRIDLLRKSTENPTSFVAKMFIADRFHNELEKLRFSRKGGLAVPDVIDAKAGVILMTFIPGEPLVDRINRTFNPELVDALAGWYYNYHSIHAMIKGDPRLRNFIWNDNKLFGLDFEESRVGHWMLDIAGIAASILDTKPVFDARKRTLAWRFLEKYLEFRGGKRNSEFDNLFLETISALLAQTSKWRDDDEIMKISQEIKSKGMPVE
jgi:tRNA A-37 threonylcarbamoyl transferase component Bud32